jgi:hypothetical protein
MTHADISTQRAADALDTLQGYDLSLILEAVEAHAKSLREQVRAADERAEARGARKWTYGDGGYVGQHDSTQQKRRTYRRLDELTSTLVTAAANRYIAEQNAKADAEVAA